MRTFERNFEGYTYDVPSKICIPFIDSDYQKSLKINKRVMLWGKHNYVNIMPVIRSLPTAAKK